MKKYILLLIVLLCAITSLQAKKSYYYYNGERIPLTICEDSVRMYYVTDRTNNAPEQYNYNSKNVFRKSVSIEENDSITSMEYIILSEDGKKVRMSNRFYVQLFDSIADVQKVITLAKRTNTIVRGQVPFMPDWYELVVHKSNINNSLELSNYFYETGLFKNVDPGFVFDFTPLCVSDHSYNSQWALPMINACSAWTITKGVPNRKIAFIDTGVERFHNEFDYNKFTDVYNCTTGTSTGYMVYHEHGTWVCGVVASNHNSAQIAGVAPNCKIIPVCYSSSDTNTVAANLASGIAWAVQHGADVINCSWGDHHCYQWLHSSTLESAIHDALTIGRNGKGCVVVFAAGEINTNTLDYPAYVYPEILTVGAMKSDSTRLSNSSYGTDLDVVAPGENILTTDIWSMSSYTTTSGSSIAASHVSGIAGLMLSVNPELTQKNVVDIIESTARKVRHGSTYYYITTDGRSNGSWDVEMGYGLVDAYAAVYKAKYETIIGPDYVCDTAKYYVANLDLSNTTISWTLSNSMFVNPPYSLYGATNSDTVIVVNNHNGLPFSDAVNVPNEGVDSENNGDRLDPSLPISNLLKATIVDNNTMHVAKKKLRLPSGAIPEVSASSSSSIWYSGTTRTFTITNCTNVPDSLLLWKVEKITERPFGIDTSIIVSQGRTLTYRATASMHATVTVNISAINTQKECLPNHVTSTYTILVGLALNAVPNNNQLNVTIHDENGQDVDFQSRLNGDGTVTLELCHSIYGLMHVQHVRSVNEVINTANLPKGVYVLCLKENGNNISEVKVRIP